MTTSKATADKLLADLKLEHLDEKEKQEVLEKLQYFFTQIIISTLLSHLDEGQLDKFKKALDSDQIEQGVNEIAQSVPGLAEAIERKMEEEYAYMKSVTSAASNA